MHHHTLKLNLTVCFLLEVLIAFSAVKASAGNLPSKAPNPEDFFLGNNETQSNTLQLENTTAAVKSQIRQVHETKLATKVILSILILGSNYILPMLLIHMN